MDQIPRRWPGMRIYVAASIGVLGGYICAKRKQNYRITGEKGLLLVALGEIYAYSCTEHGELRHRHGPDGRGPCRPILEGLDMPSVLSIVMFLMRRVSLCLYLPYRIISRGIRGPPSTYRLSECRVPSRPPWRPRCGNMSSSNGSPPSLEIF